MKEAAIKEVENPKRSGAANRNQPSGSQATKLFQSRVARCSQNFKSSATQLGQNLSHGIGLGRSSVRRLLPLHILATSNQPYMGHIIGKPFWQNRPHHWLAIVIMEKPLQVTIFVENCNCTVVMPTSGIATVVHQCCNLIRYACHIQPGIREAGKVHLQISKFKGSSVRSGCIQKSTYLETYNM